jgi:hypothetical protein
MRRLSGVVPLLLLLIPLAGLAVEEAALLELNRLYGRGRLEDAAAYADSLLAVSPGDPYVLHTLGRMAADRWDFDAARPLLQAAADADTNGTWLAAWSLATLALCDWNAGDPAAARARWETVRDLRATRNVTRQAELYLAGLFPDERFADWPVVESGHFVFRFSPRLTGLDPDAFATRHEAAFARIAHWFGWEPDGPIRMIVWTGDEEADAHGIPPLGFSRAQVSLIHARADQTVGHEMTHVISLRALRPIRIAGLLGEGIAVYHDGRRGDRLKRARVAWVGRPAAAPRPSIRELWNDWSLASEKWSYPLAGAFVEMLIEKGGRDRFLELFRDQTLERAEAIYGPEFDVWVRDFEASLGG